MEAGPQQDGKSTWIQNHLQNLWNRKSVHCEQVGEEVGVLRAGVQWKRLEEASLWWGVQRRFVLCHFASGMGEEEGELLECHSELQREEPEVLFCVLEDLVMAVGGGCFAGLGVVEEGAELGCVHWHCLGSFSVSCASVAVQVVGHH